MIIPNNENDYTNSYKNDYIYFSSTTEKGCIVCKNVHNNNRKRTNSYLSVSPSIANCSKP